MSEQADLGYIATDVQWLLEAVEKEARAQAEMVQFLMDEGEAKAAMITMHWLRQYEAVKERVAAELKKLGVDAMPWWRGVPPPPSP